MEEFQYKMINVFNNNFKCKDVKKILKLYKKDIFLVQGFENFNLEGEKYKHPLFKNYNYCLFCGQKQKTKYYSIDLINSHMELEEDNIGQYLQRNNIKLRELKNKKEKIAKRRFINSYDKNINSKTLTNKAYDESDTELYVYDKTINKNCYNIFRNKVIRRNYTNIIMDSINKKNSHNINNKNIRKSFSNENKDKVKNKKIDCNYNSKIDNFISPRRGIINLINNSSERKIYLEDSNLFETIKINLDQDMTNNKKNNNENYNIDKNSIIIDLKNSNDYYGKIKKTTSKSKKTKSNKNVDFLIETSKNSSNASSEVKVIVNDSNKNKNLKKNNKIINYEEEIDKTSIKSNKLLHVFKKAKNFLGLGNKNSQKKLLYRRNFTDKLGESDTKRTIKKSKTSKEAKIKQKNTICYLEKNDNCAICLQEIKEKFTLTCGDFFCRECIRNTIIIAIKTIIHLDELKCPTCNDLLQENAIKKLLTKEEFEKYKNLITKIEGLKNKERIPCPYPDCPGWAEENQSNHNILYCIKGHIFCKKCQKIVDKNFGDKNNKHKCFENISEEENQTMQFFKKNKSFRKCPNCQSMVMREGGGCNNMTCTNVWCGYEFCWICNRKYDDSHYRNPLSMCFGLSEMNYDGKLAKYSRMRFFRCILIFLLIIFIILPIVLVFFSIFGACLYIISFVLDGSAMKNIKLKSIFAHKLFYKIVYGFFVAIGFAYIPIGYMSIALFIIFAPFICIFNNLRDKSDEELE